MSAIRVVVVEDHPANLELLRTRLEALDCQMLAARTADEGFALVLAEKPDLVLLDLRLGEELVSGVDLLARLRADERTQATPVFIHSIYVARHGDMPNAEAMANGILLKPFKFEDLKKIIEGFRKPASPSSAGQRAT